MNDLQSKPRIVREVIGPTEKEISILAKSKINKLTKRLNSNLKKDSLCIAFAAWVNFSQLSKLRRATNKQEIGLQDKGDHERVYIKQTLEVYDGTMNVYTALRKQIVQWTCSVYAGCNSHLDPDKK